MAEQLRHLMCKHEDEFGSPAPTQKVQVWQDMSVFPALEDRDRNIPGLVD